MDISVKALLTRTLPSVVILCTSILVRIAIWKINQPTKS